MIVTTRAGFLRTVGRAVGRRLALGVVIALLATVIGWTLVPPSLGTDAATVRWYTQ